ncbi:MAG: pyrroloquinoline quinone biosynthesis protein PqqE [Deltaproteobacteria bacterium]|nr:pyrroloquinoline quinone biosynthesis protein PqqE [Deltaproteobacteria bacterium]
MSTRWVPTLHRHARLHHDTVRDRWAVLDPERVLFLSPSAHAVITLCDGSRSDDDIVGVLTQRFAQPSVETDVRATLSLLHARGALGYDPLAIRMDPARMPSETATVRALAPPLALTAELTHRCPLQCGYCSNPVDLAKHQDSLSAANWLTIIDECADAGVLQCSLSGGEPLLFEGLDSLIAHARKRGMYCNLITSAWRLTDDRIRRLRDHGLEHVQISLQHTDARRADAIAHAHGAHAQKLAAAERVVAHGMALSINTVLHRETVAHVRSLCDLAANLGAVRIELASVQSHGWALINREGLLPDAAACAQATVDAREAQRRHHPHMRVIAVINDYYADRPKPCMDGWGQKFITVSPDGMLLPCPGAHELGLTFDSVLQGKTVSELWQSSESLARFRGDAWMDEPCRSCDERHRDHGGCRCQAYALTRSLTATDPTCSKSPMHGLIVDARARAEAPRDPVITPRSLVRRPPDTHNE